MNTAPSDIDALLNGMSARLAALLAERGVSEPVMVGIHTGGVWVAQRLHELLELTSPLGELDISFYRDDFTRIGVNPQVRPSRIPLDIEGRHIILVDDVLYTGRTIRAALNELFDYGRPASVILVVLAERNGRELPIQADVAGRHIDLPPHRHIKLQGPSPLELKTGEAP